MNFLNGKKTYAVGIALVGYVVVSWLTQSEIDQNIINALLGGGLVTLRMGVKEDKVSP